MNLIYSQSKVISIFQILIFYFAGSIIILFFIVSEMLLTSINLCKNTFRTLSVTDRRGC